eukprot:g2405.t1
MKMLVSLWACQVIAIGFGLSTEASPRAERLEFQVHRYEKEAMDAEADAVPGKELGAAVLRMPVFFVVVLKVQESKSLGKRLGDN